MSGFGILQVRKRPRMGAIPTGEVIKIKASKKVAFRPPRTSRWRSDRRHRLDGIIAPAETTAGRLVYDPVSAVMAGLVPPSR